MWVSEPLFSLSKITVKRLVEWVKNASLVSWDDWLNSTGKQIIPRKNKEERDMFLLGTMRRSRSCAPFYYSIRFFYFATFRLLVKEENYKELKRKKRFVKKGSFFPLSLSNLHFFALFINSSVRFGFTERLFFINDHHHSPQKPPPTDGQKGTHSQKLWCWAIPFDDKSASGPHEILIELVGSAHFPLK